MFHFRTHPVVTVPLARVLVPVRTVYDMPDMRNREHQKAVQDAFRKLANTPHAIRHLLARIAAAGREHTVAIYAALCIAQYVQTIGVPSTTADADACRAFFLTKVQRTRNVNVVATTPALLKDRTDVFDGVFKRFSKNHAYVLAAENTTVVRAADVMVHGSLVSGSIIGNPRLLAAYLGSVMTALFGSSGCIQIAAGDLVTDPPTGAHYIYSK